MQSRIIAGRWSTQIFGRRRDCCGPPLRGTVSSETWSPGPRWPALSGDQTNVNTVRAAVVSVPAQIGVASVTLEIERPWGVVRFYGLPDPELVKPFVGEISRNTSVVIELR